VSHPPKIDRKTLKQPDTFVSKGQGVLEWMVSQKMRFLPLLVAVIVLLIGGYGFDYWTAARLDEAWKAYSAAAKANEPQKWDDLKSVSTKYKSTRPGVFASVELGDHYFSSAKKGLLTPPDEAAKKADAEKQAMADAALAADWYSKALEFSELLPAEKQLLYVNRGEALETQKKYDEAAADYKMAAEFTGDTKPLALLGQARVLDLKNDKTKAAEAYERITVDFANTEYAKIAKNLLRRLKSPLFSEQSS
jgi:tetratricopeptide (TPR) repeat protein